MATDATPTPIAAPAPITIVLGVPQLFSVTINGTTYAMTLTISMSATGISITADSKVTADSAQAA